MCTSAFCGQIDELPGIIVDNFENPHEQKARAYFLSHCHQDHTQGLYSEGLIEALEKSGVCLYMSEQTAMVIDHEKKDPRIMKYVKPLKLGKHTIPLPSDPNGNSGSSLIWVTVIPAAHSFGSVMYLFKTTKKTVLFTGDFRMCPSDLQKFGPLHTNGDPITIDALYVDTTFICQRYLNFPKRSESIESLLEVIKRHLQKKNGRIALHTSARYGYEFIFNEIWKKLQLKVYVGERWSFYSKVLHLVPGVTNEEFSTKIHLCRNMSEKTDHNKCLKNQDNLDFLYIHFSAMKWGDFGIDDNTFNKISDKRIDVCFATHCSRSELLYFVKYLAPKKVVGFPVPYPKEDNVQSFNVFSKKNDNVQSFNVVIKKRKISGKEEKNSKVNKRMDKELLKEIFDI